MKRKITLIIIALIVQYGSYAQAPVIQWQKSYGGTNSEEGNAAVLTSDGGYIIAGNTSSSDVFVTFNHGGTDIWLVKLNALGNMQWQISFGGTADDGVNEIRQTQDGGYVIAGWTQSNDGDVSGNHGGKDWWIVKLDSAGSIDWQHAFGGSGNEEALSIEQTSDGGYIAAGFTFSNDFDVSGNNGGQDVWVIKMDALGNSIWRNVYGGSLDEKGWSIRETNDGGYVFAASASSNDGDVSINLGSSDFWIVKLDAIGGISWEHSYGGTKADDPRSIIQTFDEGYAVTGITRSNDGDLTSNHGSQDIWVLKIDSLGAFQKQRALGGSLRDRGQVIRQVTDGGYVVLSSTESTNGNVSGNHGGWDFWLVKVDSASLNTEWKRTFGGSGDDFAHSLALLPADGYLIFGNTTSNDDDVTLNFGLEDYWVAKLLRSCPPGTVTGNISGDTTICVGTSAALVLSFTGTPPWIFSINGGSPQTTSNNPDTIYVSPASNTNYSITSVYDAACAGAGTASGTAHVTLINSPGVTPVFTGFIASACNGNESLFTITPVSGQNINYNWIANNARFSNNSGGPFVAGPFATSAPQVYVMFDSLTNNASGYSICATAFNNCGSTNNACKWVRGKIGTPGPISGNTVACPNDTIIYTSSIPTGADTMMWTFSVPGVTITPLSPSGNQVRVIFLPSFSPGYLCVTAALSCLGSSVSAPRCLNISNAPALPGVISGPLSACAGNVLTYSIPPVNNATNYTWSAPSGFLFNGNPSPFTTTALSVSVTFPATFNSSAHICVSANSPCTNGPARCKTVYSIPAKPGLMTPSPATWCAGGAVNFTIAAVNGATSYNWTITNGTITGGQGTTSLSVTWGSGAGSVSVSASNSCGTGLIRTQSFSSSCRESADGAIVTGNNTLVAYPNPAHDKITATFNSSGDRYLLTLTDITGRIVFNDNSAAVKGFNTIEIDIKGYAKGMYVLQVSAGEQEMQTKISVE